MHSRSASNPMMPLEPAYAGLAERVRTEFRRRPSLSLTADQVAEWLDLEDGLSRRVLEALTSEGLLECHPDRSYRLLLQH